MMNVTSKEYRLGPLHVGSPGKEVRWSCSFTLKAAVRPKS